MKKDGFVFVESIVVLVVVALSIAMLISSYALVSRKTKEKERYNKTADKYLTYVVSRMGTDDLCNYSIACTGIAHRTIGFRADRDNSKGYSCSSTKVGDLMYDCENVFKDLGIVRLYVVENIRNELNDLDRNGNPKGSSEKKAYELYDNGTIEYMKTLKKCNDVNSIDTNGQYINNNNETTKCINPIKYLIGVFERESKYYYASIEL